MLIEVLNYTINKKIIINAKYIIAVTPPVGGSEITTIKLLDNFVCYTKDKYEDIVKHLDVINI